jgi:hypothetical protein
LDESFTTALKCLLFAWCTEKGPLTLGYDRWANLAPEVVELQSFGHASVSEDGELTIKLINIDGNLLYEKTMTPVSSDGTFSEEGSATINSTSSGEVTTATDTTTESTASSSSEGSATTSTVIEDTSTTNSTVSEEITTGNSTTAYSSDKGGVSSSGSGAMINVMSSWWAIVVLFAQW